MTDPLEIARTAVLDIGTVCSAHKQRKILAHAYLSALETISAGVDAIKEGIKTDFSHDYKDVESPKDHCWCRSCGWRGKRAFISKPCPHCKTGGTVHWGFLPLEDATAQRIFWEKDQATQTPPSTADSLP